MRKLLKHLTDNYLKETILAPLFKMLEAILELLVPLVVAAIIDTGIGNGDKGYVARELRSRGAAVRPYFEHMNKQVKIAAHLRKWWPTALFVKGTDSAYLSQILDYTDQSEHDDAPDSAACLVRALEKRRSV